MELNPRDRQDTQVQETYARWLDFGARTGFAVSLVTLLVYLSGALVPFVAMERLAALWRLPVGRYLELTGGPAGWGWTRLLGYGDYLNLAGVALFATVSIVCYLRALPALLAHGDRLYALIAAAQIAVLLLAASGLLNSFAGG
jgi:hypothetical protein